MPKLPIEEIMNSAENPWGSEEVCLKGVCLSSSQKSWLAKECIEKRTTTAAVTKKYGIPNTNVRRWVSQLQSRGILRAKAGRQALLDEESVESMKVFAQTPPPPTRRQFYEELNKERCKTARRRGISLTVDDGEDSFVETVATSSKHNYFKRICIRVTTE